MCGGGGALGAGCRRGATPVGTSPRRRGGGGGAPVHIMEGEGAPGGWGRHWGGMDPNGSFPPPTPPHPQRDWTATDRTAACGRRVRMPCVYRKHPKAGERTVAKASNTDHSNHQRINCCECEGVGPLATTHWPDVLLLWFDLSELLA